MVITRKVNVPKLFQMVGERKWETFFENSNVFLISIISLHEFIHKKLIKCMEKCNFLNIKNIARIDRIYNTYIYELPLSLTLAFLFRNAASHISLIDMIYPNKY